MPNYTEYDATPANNNSPPPVGAPEGMQPSTVNDTMRYMMAVIRDLGNRLRRGSTVVATNINGSGTVSFSTPFPSVPTVVICNGDGTATTSDFQIISVTATGFNFRSTPAAPSQSVRVNYIASIV